MLLYSIKEASKLGHICHGQYAAAMDIIEGCCNEIYLQAGTTGFDTQKNGNFSSTLLMALAFDVLKKATCISICIHFCKCYRNLVEVVPKTKVNARKKSANQQVSTEMAARPL